MTYPRVGWTCNPRRRCPQPQTSLTPAQRGSDCGSGIPAVTHARTERGYGCPMTTTPNEPTEPNASPAGDPGEVPGEEPGSPSEPQDFPETDPEAEPDDGNAEPGQMPDSTDPIINA